MQEAHEPALEARPVGVAVATPYLPELESLRGIAMLLVLFFHIDVNIDLPLEHIGGRMVSPALAYVHAGHSGVDLFFILSAFLLSLPFLGQAAGGKPVSVRRYFGRRALRILPLYYAAVFVASVLSATQPRDLLRGAPYLFFLNFAALATALPPYSWVWWSLATEVQFYLLLPLLPLAIASLRGRIGGILALALWAAAYGAFLARKLQAHTIAGQIALGNSLLGRGPLFLAGLAAAWIYLHHGEALRRRMTRAALLRNGGADVALFATLTTLAYLLRWVVWIGPQNERSPPYHAWHLIEAALWAVVLLLLLLAPLRLKPVFSNRVLKRLGVLSYSIYILHVPMMVFAFRVLQHLWPFPIGWHPHTLLVASLICLACVALAEVTYRGIERPFLRRKELLRA